MGNEILPVNIEYEQPFGVFLMREGTDEFPLGVTFNAEAYFSNQTPMTVVWLLLQMLWPLSNTCK
jgi:hypothetical protein